MPPAAGLYVVTVVAAVSAILPVVFCKLPVVTVVRSPMNTAAALVVSTEVIVAVCEVAFEDSEPS